MTDAQVQRFWAAARTAVPRLPVAPPAAWAFGARSEPAQADQLLTLVLRGVKTATSSSLWDYEANGEPLPAEGDLGIVLDGSSIPRAVIETTAVTVVAFDDVGEAHAFAEGEGDRTLASWRRVHERFWRRHSGSATAFAADLPVVCETFAVLYAEPALR